MSALLGIWESGWVPGIGSIDKLADDVQTDRLSFALRDVETAECSYALVNSKGFGGNNATATVLSPDVSRALLEKRHSAGAISIGSVLMRPLSKAVTISKARVWVVIGSRCIVLMTVCYLMRMSV